MFHIALLEPEIPHNTGNIIRLCANTGCSLHLIEPLGFSLDDRYLKRAGLDYHRFTTITVHADWASFRAATEGCALIVFSTKSQKPYHELVYRPGMILLFGAETRGVRQEIIDEFIDKKSAARIPMMPQSRSINLSNAVSIVVYEAWRQNNFMIAGK